MVVMNDASSVSRSRSVLGATSIPEQRMTAAFTARGLRDIPGTSLDPFISMDEFRMSRPTFPPHPHAGFSAVTYMFERSDGGFVNRDSLGDRSRITPGSLHWTQAARGMMHEEVPETPGVECHGLQIFVNLRAVHKTAPPRAFHLDTADVPEIVTTTGARVRVLAGTVSGVSSPLTDLLTPVLLLDVHVPPRTRVELPVDPAWSCFAMAIGGAGTVGSAGSTARGLRAHEAVGFAQDGDHVELAASDEGLHVIVAGGAPLREPIVFGGPFAMTNRADLEAAIARYQRGEMGRLE
jgi:redox-sensitive bicupin YhaK (pirin superfamily)